jgi:hypothetical protein
LKGDEVWVKDAEALQKAARIATGRNCSIDFRFAVVSRMRVLSEEKREKIKSFDRSIIDQKYGASD